MSSAVSPVSDERLKQIVAYVELMGPNSEPCVPGDVAQSMAAELLSRRSLDTAEPAGWQWRMRTRQVPAAPWGEWCEWRDGKANVSERISSHAEYEERPVFASRTPNTEMVVKADQIAGYCATEGCDNAGTERFEAGGVGSVYCPDCLSKVKALASPPSPAEVTNEQAEAVARAHYDARMDRKGAYDDAPAGTKAVEKVFAKIALVAALQLNKKTNISPFVFAEQIRDGL